MDGVHDVGGMDGFGPVGHRPDEPVFDHPWERAVFAMAFPVMASGLTLDAFRHGIEKMHPVDYLSSPYYEHWRFSLENGLVAAGLLTREEIDGRTQQFLDDPTAALPQRSDPAAAQAVVGFLKSGAPARRGVEAEPAFAPNDRVLVRNLHPQGHTRLVGYLRGKRGVVEAAHGAFVFPDTHAHGLGRQPQHVYTVGFDAAEVWGPEADPRAVNHVDMWESYLLAIDGDADDGMHPTR